MERVMIGTRDTGLEVREKWLGILNFEFVFFLAVPSPQHPVPSPQPYGNWDGLEFGAAGNLRVDMMAPHSNDPKVYQSTLSMSR